MAAVTDPEMIPSLRRLWLDDTEHEDAAAGFREQHPESWLSCVYAVPDPETFEELLVRGPGKMEVWKKYLQLRMAPESSMGVVMVFNILHFGTWVMTDYPPQRTLLGKVKIVIPGRSTEVRIVPLELFLEEMNKQGE